MHVVLSPALAIVSLAIAITGISENIFSFYITLVLNSYLFELEKDFTTTINLLLAINR